MKSKRLLISLLTVSLTASLVLSACGKKKEDGEKPAEGGNETSSEVKMDKEQYLNLLLQAEPKSLDAAKSTDSYSSQVLTNVMEALTRIKVDEDGKETITPGAAKVGQNLKMEKLGHLN